MKQMGDRLMVVRVIVGRTVLSLISAYVPQAGRHRQDKEEFFTLLGKIVSKIDDGEKLLICRDLNGHVGFGFGKRNVDGEMILEFAHPWNFVVANTWFKKNEGRLISVITYETDKCRTVIDYILIRKSERKRNRDVKVIQLEQCLSKHKLTICVLDLKEGLNKRKKEFVKDARFGSLKMM